MNRTTATLSLALALVVGCAPPSTTGTSSLPDRPSSSPSASLPSASPSMPSPAGSVVGAADLHERLAIAADTVGAMVAALAVSIDAGDLDRIRSDVVAIHDWASDEKAWLNDHAHDPCITAAWDAYAQALADLTLGALSLDIALIASGAAGSPPTDEIERAIQRIVDGHEELIGAQLIVQTADCSERSAPPSAAAAAMTTDAYRLLAGDLHDRYLAIQASVDRRSDPKGYADRLLLLEDEALAAVSAWGAGGADVAELETAIEAVRTHLRSVLTVASTERARSNLLTALFILAEQRAAADGVRAGIGLPATEPADLL